MDAGDSFKSSLVAVVVPVIANISQFASSGGKSDSTPEALCRDPTVKAKLLESLTATGKEGKLKGFEMVRAVYLEPEAFSIENGLLTPTFKLKRPQLLSKYKSEVEGMYDAMK